MVEGAGGCLGHKGIQYKAMGMRIVGVGGGKDKKELCMKLGAEHYLDLTTQKDIMEKIMDITTYGAHRIIAL